MNFPDLQSSTADSLRSIVSDNIARIRGGGKKIVQVNPGTISPQPNTEYHGIATGEYIIPAFAPGMSFIGAGPQTVLFAPAKGSAFNCAPDAAGIYLANVRVYAHTDAGVATGTFGTLRGKDIAMENIWLGTLGRGLVLSGCDGAYIKNVQTTRASVIRSQCFYAEDAKHVGVSGMNLNDSQYESLVRATVGGKGSVGLADSFFVDLEMHQLPPDLRADSTIRCGNNIGFFNVKCFGSDFSIKTGGAEANSTPTTITNVVVKGLYVYGGKVIIGDYAANVTIDGAEIFNDGAECVDVVRHLQPRITGVRLSNIVGHSRHKLLKLEGDILAGKEVIATNCALVDSGQAKTPWATTAANAAIPMATFGMGNAQRAA